MLIGVSAGAGPDLTRRCTSSTGWPSPAVRQTVAMAPRRALTLLFLLLVTVTVIGSTSAPRRDPDPGAVPAPAGAPAEQVTGRLPADRTITARVGQVVNVEVTSLQPDTAEIARLGLKAPVGPGLEGTAITLVADVPGRFAVTVGLGRTRVGVLVIKPARSR